MTQTIVIPNAGKESVASVLGGLNTNYPTHLAIGTGVHTASATDTALTTQSGSSIAGTVSVITTTLVNDTLQVIGSFTAGLLTPVTELGLFDAATAGNMYLEATFDAVNLQIGDTLQITTQIQFS